MKLQAVDEKATPIWLLSNPKVIELAKKIEAINPKIKEGAARSGSSIVFEI
jgi:hypothetical protein